MFEKNRLGQHIHRSLNATTIRKALVLRFVGLIAFMAGLALSAATMDHSRRAAAIAARLTALAGAALSHASSGGFTGTAPLELIPAIIIVLLLLRTGPVTPHRKSAEAVAWLVFVSLFAWHLVVLT